MYWTLFIILTTGLNESEDKQYIPVLSSITREECEASKTVGETLVVSHPLAQVEIKCLKTDEWKPGDLYP